MTAPATALTHDERRHLQAAARPGHMYRIASGTVVINPAPTARANIAVAVHNPRRNAKQAVVETLRHRGLLAEDNNGQFSVTTDGLAALHASEAST